MKLINATLLQLVPGRSVSNRKQLAQLNETRDVIFARGIQTVRPKKFGVPGFQSFALFFRHLQEFQVLCGSEGGLLNTRNPFGDWGLQAERNMRLGKLRQAAKVLWGFWRSDRMLSWGG